MTSPSEKKKKSFIETSSFIINKSWDIIHNMETFVSHHEDEVGDPHSFHPAVP